MRTFHFAFRTPTNASGSSPLDNWKREYVRNNETSHIIQNVAGDMTYKVHMQSVSYAGSSLFNASPLTVKVENSGKGKARNLGKGPSESLISPLVSSL